jgi:hypothetical protein
MPDPSHVEKLLAKHNSYDDKIKRYQSKQRNILNKVLKIFDNDLIDAIDSRVMDRRVLNIEGCIQFHEKAGPRRLEPESKIVEPKQSKKSSQKQNQKVNDVQSIDSDSAEDERLEELQSLHHVFNKDNILPRAPFSREDILWISKNVELKTTKEMIAKKPQFKKNPELLMEMVSNLKKLDKKKRKAILSDDFLENFQKKARTQ